MKLKPKSFAIVFVFIFLFVFLRLPSLFEPYWYGDEGIYLVLGQAIRRGYTLYTQIHDNKPPTLYHFAAISKTIFGFRLFLLLYMIPTIYFFNKLSKKYLSKKKSILATLLFLVLSSIPFIEGNIANAEVFMLLPTILAFLIYKPTSLKSLFFSGLLLGFAFTFKVPVVIELCTLIFFSLSTFLATFIKKPSLKKIKSAIMPSATLLLSFFIPILVLGLYYSYKSALSEFLFASLLQNFSYLSSWKTGSHSSGATQGGVTVRAFLLLIFWIFNLFLYIKKKLKPSSYILILWFSSTIFGSLLSTRPYPHYLIQTLPPLCLLAFSLFETKKSFSRVSKSIAITLIMFLAYVFKFYNFYTYPVIPYYRSFYQNLKNPSVFQNYFGTHVSQNNKIVDYLSPKLSSQDKIFVWGDSPYLYTLLDKIPSDRYTVAYHIVDFDGYFDTIIALKKFPPKFIIYYSMPTRPFEELDDLISKYYILDNQIDSVSIYKKR